MQSGTLGKSCSKAGVSSLDEEFVWRSRVGPLSWRGYPDIVFTTEFR